MKAAVLEKVNSPLIIKEINIPKLQPGQVLVKIAFSGICHSQLMEVQGKRGVDNYLPHLLGHEGSGIVTYIGENVKKVKVGDKVILGWIKSSGQDVGSTKYTDLSGKVVNAGAVTTFSEFSVVSENRCTIIPDGVPMDIAVLFGCAVLTGAGIVTNSVKPAPGSKIAIFGLGGIGLSALMAASLYNCSMVVAIDVKDEKLELAKQLGATHTINSLKFDPVKSIDELTKGEMLDYSIESAGLIQTIEQAFNSIKRKGGLCIFASHPQNGEKISIDPYELICGKNIKGTWGGMCNPDVDIPKFAKLYKDGRLPLEKLITKRYSLNNINEAFSDLEKGIVFRPLIDFGI